MVETKNEREEVEKEEDGSGCIAIEVCDKNYCRRDVIHKNLEHLSEDETFVEHSYSSLKEQKFDEEEDWLVRVEEARNIVFNWLDHLRKKIDFIYVNKAEDLVLTNDLKDIEGRVCDPYVSNQDPFLRDNVREIRNTITDDIVDKINGKCAVTLKNNEQCHGNWVKGKRVGLGSFLGGNRLDELGITMIAGEYIEGCLTGHVRMTMLDESVREGWFQQGFLHGPVKGTDKLRQLTYVGWYERGLAVGTCWTKWEGGGWLVGKMAKDGTVTGDNIAFLYPDLSTAVVGRFECGELVEAFPATLVAAEMNKGVLEPEFKRKEEVVYRRWISTREDVVCPPHQPDVYEKRLVEVGMSLVEGGGEGLFAKEDIDEDILVAYYNGVRIKPGEEGVEEDTGYSIYIDWGQTRSERIKSEHMDIPSKYQSSANYTSTMGHKVNHSFDPNCQFVVAVHPCFGRIPAVKTIKPVHRGDELLVHYFMDMEETYEWYREAWSRFTEQLRQAEDS
jgi:histone-lysine N-methyltransferase SETD7